MEKIKEFNINYKKIKRLYINSINSDNKNLYKLSELIKFENTLTHLTLDFNCDIESNIFDILNNFKILKVLFLKKFNFKEKFIITLKSLNILELDSCNNITLSQECANNIRSFHLLETDIKNNNVDNILKFPKIEKFLCECVEEGSTIKNYIDFKSMIKLMN